VRSHTPIDFEHATMYPCLPRTAFPLKLPPMQAMHLHIFVLFLLNVVSVLAQGSHVAEFTIHHTVADVARTAC